MLTCMKKIDQTMTDQTAGTIRRHMQSVAARALRKEAQLQRTVAVQTTAANRYLRDSRRMMRACMPGSKACNEKTATAHRRAACTQKQANNSTQATVGTIGGHKPYHTRMPTPPQPTHKAAYTAKRSCSIPALNCHQSGPHACTPHPTPTLLQQL